MPPASRWCSPGSATSATEFSFSCGGRGGADDARLADRQVGERGHGREQCVGVPHPAVIAEIRDRETAEPGAVKSAELMRQEGQPEQCREIPHTKQFSDEPGSRWHG